MITYKKAQYKELVGEFEAVISAVEMATNDYYDPSKENSTSHVLHISFELTQNGETTPFRQMYVSPLTGGRSIFQQLLTAIDYDVSEDGGDLDEETFLGSHVLVTMGKNKKGYDTIVSVSADESVKKAPKKAVKKEEAEEVFAE